MVGIVHEATAEVSAAVKALIVDQRAVTKPAVAAIAADLLVSTEFVGAVEDVHTQIDHKYKVAGAALDEEESIGPVLAVEVRLSWR